MSWGDMQPILLRSAALVGLVAAIAVAVSSDAFFAGPEPRPAEEAVVLIVQEEPKGAQSAAAAATPVEPIATPVAAAAAARPGSSTEIGASAPLSLPDSDGSAPEAAITTHAPPAAAALATPAAVPESIAVPPAAAVTPAPPQTTTVPSAAAVPLPVQEPPAEPASVGSLPAVECPRDWVGVEGQTAGAGSCEELAALLPGDANPAEQRLMEAASQRAAEIAALQFVPRIPKARPDPPPQLRKTARKAKWPAGSPPNCGKKHAYWRYVSNVPTWYCK